MADEVSRPDLLYALRDPRDGAIRYIGITNDPGNRQGGHRRECRSGKHYRGRWWRKVFSETGVEPTMHVIVHCNDLDWRSVEPFFIVSGRYFGLRLTNSCDGGEGVRNPTPEVRAKIAAAKIGKTRKPHSPETKARISAAAKNRPSHVGRKFTQEAKARMSVSAKARGIPAEQREKIAASLRSMSDEARVRMRARMSAAHKGRPHPPMSDETRALISAARKGKALSAEHREKIAAGLRAFNAARNGAQP